MNPPTTHGKQPDGTVPALRRALAGKRLLALGLAFVLIAAGWATLFAMSWEVRGDDDSALLAMLAALCRPAEETGAWTLWGALAMWTAMVFAMMLPSAVPMLDTYLDIAETASEKGMTVTDASFLLAGYLVVWLAASVGLAGAQVFASTWLTLEADPRLASPYAAGVVLMLAGVFQFSNLKQACLEKCRNPLATFLGDWRQDRAGIFHLGQRQGLYCLGCCWALILVMFAVGLMNLVWMALLGAIMVLEKVISRADHLRRATGAGLLALGMLVMAL